MEPIKSFALKAIVAFGLSGVCHAELIGQDSFQYQGSSLDGADGGTFWDYGVRTIASASPVHSGNASDWDVLFGAVIASGGKLYTAESGAKREYSGITEGSGSDESLGYFTDSAMSQSVFYRIDMTRGDSVSWCGLSSFEFANEKLFFGLFPDGTNKFSIYDQRTFTPLVHSTVDVNVGQKYTLVVRMDITPLGGSGCQLRLYVNPNLSVAENPATAVASVFLPGLNRSTAMRVASGGDGLVEWDDLTVADSWASLRTYPVTTFADSGAGSLRQAIADAAPGGGRIHFPAAESLFAVTEDNRLLRFLRTTPGTIASNLSISGLLGGETLQGIDFGADSQLYGLGIINPAGANNAQGRLYQIDIVTGVATRLGAVAFSTTMRSSLGYFGFAYDAAADSFRVVSESGDNLRVNPTGTLAAVGSPIPASSLLSAIAYDRRDSEGAQLYGIDLNGKLVRIGGTASDPMVKVIGNLGSSDFGASDGFDITPDGIAWVTSVRSGLNRVNTVNLATGLATEKGTIGSGTWVITGLAAAPESIHLFNQIDVLSSQSILIDAPESSGLTLDGGGATRLFYLGEHPPSPSPTKAVIAMRNMTLTGGNGVGPVSGPGGAIYLRAGNLHLENCTLAGNTANAGGAIRAIAPVRLSRCTFAGNTAGSGAAIAAAGLTMIHCTVSGNASTATQTESIYGFGAVLVDASIAAVPPVLRHCLVAGNTAVNGQGPDLSGFGTIASYFSLIGNGADSGIGNGSNGSRVGTSATPLDARVAPLGYYGGPTSTMPVLPDSLAVNLAATSVSRIDQRGRTMNSIPDAGATEFSGSSDLALYWDTDWDGDGAAYGLEFAIGTDALRGDSSAPQSLKISIDGGTPLLTFGLNNAARPYSRWVMKRSVTLNDFSEEIYSFNGRTNANVVAPGIFQGSIGGLISVRDQLPNPPNEFYRLEAHLLP